MSVRIRILCYLRCIIDKNRSKKSIQNRPKIKNKLIKKSTKHRPKINQNRPKIDQNTTWADGVPHLGRWGTPVLVASPGCIGSWGALGIVLEASWNRLGRKKWPTWLQLGPKLAPKTEAKSVLSRPGGVLRASWRPHVFNFMHF